MRPKITSSPEATVRSSFRLLGCYLIATLCLSSLAWGGALLVLHFWIDPQYSEEDLYGMAKSALSANARAVQDAADDVLRLWDDTDGNGEMVVACMGSPLDSFGRRLQKRYSIYERFKDPRSHHKFLQWKFGGRSSHAWVVVYPSQEDVSDIDLVRWIGEHIGVRYVPLDSQGDPICDYRKPERQ